MKFISVCKESVVSVIDDIIERDKSEFRNYFKMERGADDKEDSVYKFFLDQLDCIDAKASSLLTYDAMIMAINIFFLTTIDKTEKLLAYYIVSANVLVSAISAVLCLFIVDIFGPHIIDNYEVDHYIDITLKVVCKRTHIFRTALVMSRIHGIVLFFVYAALLFGLI
jgi:hypothetical protein